MPVLTGKTPAPPPLHLYNVSNVLRVEEAAMFRRLWLATEPVLKATTDVVLNNARTTCVALYGSKEVTLGVFKEAVKPEQQRDCASKQTCHTTHTDMRDLNSLTQCLKEGFEACCLPQ